MKIRKTFHVLHVSNTSLVYSSNTKKNTIFRAESTSRRTVSWTSDVLPVMMGKLV